MNQKIIFPSQPVPGSMLASKLIFGGFLKVLRWGLMFNQG